MKKPDALRLSALFASWALGAGAAPALANGDVASGEIAFSGRISDAAAASLIPALGRGRTLRITSQGGDEAAALAIAEAIFSQGVQVHVSGYCLSACANAILPAAKSISIDAGAVIALHGSAFASERNYQRLGETPPAAITQLSSGYRALYSRAGVSLALLDCAAKAIELTTEHVSVDQPNGAPRVGWKSVYEWWAPATRDLASFGLRLDATSLARNDEIWREAAKRGWSAAGVRARFETVAEACP